MTLRSPRLTYPLLTVGLLAVCAAIYLWYFWPPLETRLFYRDVPVARLDPTQLPDRTIFASAGSTLSYLGYEFEVPWDDAETSNAKASGNVAIIPFRSGLTIAFLTHSPREFVDNLASSGLVKRDQLCEIYGNAACESDFSFKRILFEATPDKLGFFTPRRESGRQSYLLLLKAASMWEPSGLFLIDTQDFRGFQFGDPQKARGNIVDELYAKDVSLEFIFGRNDRHALGISQSEINRVLHTTRRTASNRVGLPGQNHRDNHLPQLPNTLTLSAIQKFRMPCHLDCFQLAFTGSLRVIFKI